LAIKEQGYYWTNIWEERTLVPLIVPIVTYNGDLRQVLVKESMLIWNKFDLDGFSSFVNPHWFSQGLSHILGSWRIPMPPLTHPYASAAA
jgi:hypothetical protein